MHSKSNKGIKMKILSIIIITDKGWEIKGSLSNELVKECLGEIISGLKTKRRNKK